MLIIDLNFSLICLEITDFIFGGDNIRKQLKTTQVHTLCGKVSAAKYLYT